MDSYARLLRNRPFVLLWLGQIISRLGDVLYYAGMLWLVKELTHSNTITGLAGMAMAIPQLIGPLAGVLVDRLPRRAILLTSDLVRGVLVLAVPLLAWRGLLSAWGVIAVVFCLSLVSQFFFPAKQALIPELVDAAGLMTANALDTMAQSGTQVLGFLLAGTLIAVVGPVQMFSLNGLSFFISAVFILLMGALPRVAATAQTTEAGGPAAGGNADAAQTAAGGDGSLMGDLRQGISFLWRTPLTRVLIPAAMVVNLVFGPAMVLLPSLSNDVLLAGARGYGYLEGAMAAGMLLGSALVPVLTRLPRAVTLGGGLTLMGLSFVGVGLSSQLPLTLGLMALMGATNAVVNIVFITLLQSMVPNRMQGRIFATLGTLVSVANPIGLGLSGLLADRFSVPAVYIAAGVVTVLTAAAVAIPMTRVLRALQSAEPQQLAPPQESARLAPVSEAQTG